MLHYLKFFNFYLAVAFGIGVIWLGENFIAWGFLLYLFVYVAGDAWLGDDNSEPVLLNAALLKWMLYSALPLACVIFITSIWLGMPGTLDWVDELSQRVGYDFYQAKVATALWQKALAVVFLGLLLGGVATTVAHELVHKVGNPVAVCIGRWLLAFSFDANFSIEHVYNHHVKVATSADPVTAPRGRNVYVHFLFAIIGTQRAAWQIESKRLAKKQRSSWSLANRCIRGWLMSAVLLCLAYMIGKTEGMLMFIAVAVMCKFILEVVNYMEHYGLVRDPSQPVQPRHSWNSNKKVSCWTMFNLPRHSHHHAQGAVPFEKLKAMPDAPVMISGYIATMGIALIPPLWFKLMQPRLKHWDEHFANDKEKRILATQ